MRLSQKVLTSLPTHLYYVIVTLTDDSIKSKHEIEELTGFNVMAYIEDINPKNYPFFLLA